MNHFKAAAKIIFLSDLTCDKTHVLGRCENYDLVDAGWHHRLVPPGIRAGPCIAKYLSHVWLNESADVNNSVKNETFEQRFEFNISFVLLNLPPVVILEIVNMKNRCL